MSYAAKIAKLFSNVETRVVFDPDWTEEELLDQEHFIPYTKAMDKLGVDARRLRHYIQGIEDPYATFGIKKFPGSHYHVKMTRFKKHLEDLRKRFPLVRFKSMPYELSQDDFFSLQGVYKFNDVLKAGYLKLDPRLFPLFIDTRGYTRKECGFWKVGRVAYVDFQKFLVCAYSYMQNISLEEARAAFKQAQKEA